MSDFTSTSENERLLIFVVTITAGFVLNIVSLLLVGGEANEILFFINILMSFVAFFSIPYFCIINKRLKDNKYSLIYIPIVLLYFILFDKYIGILSVLLMLSLYFFYDKAIKIEKMDFDINTPPLLMILNNNIKIRYSFASFFIYVFFLFWIY